MKRNTTADFFDDYSEGFTSIYNTGNSFLQQMINKWFRKSMLIRFEKTIKACKPSQEKTALDVGCGPGNYGIALAKNGLKSIHSIDFAPKMIDIAKNQAKLAGVENICKFEIVDFTHISEDTKYDYVILMGFMDYIQNPDVIIAKALRFANEKVLFSFPSDSGFLAWQRRIRYKFKCPLFLYNEKQIASLFEGIAPWQCRIENLGRDFFVTIDKEAD
ncbi:MAG: methyltransferase domain-containing protein [Candidatus Cloacimonadaceae bacterium]|nr:methyltransferase domain-containing protein [Candidatus Cloacimonadaceae bacterium]